MKRLIFIPSLLLPAIVFAQNYPGMGGGNMNQMDMQQMMQKAQEMQACMQGVDPSKLEQLEQQARQVESEVKALCSKGKRDDAQNEATAFATEMLGNPDIQTIMKCGEQMRGMMPEMPYLDQANNTDPSGNHVCD